MVTDKPEGQVEFGPMKSTAGFCIIVAPRISEIRVVQASPPETVTDGTALLAMSDTNWGQLNPRRMFC